MPKVERYKRQGRDPRGVSGVAGRGVAQGREALLIRRGTPEEAVQQITAASLTCSMPRGGSIAVKPRRPELDAVEPAAARRLLE